MKPPAVLCCHLPVQCAVLDGLGHVRALDILAAVQVGDGPGDLEDAGVGPGAQTETLHGLFEQPARFGINRAVPSDLPAAHLGVAADLSTLEALRLNRPRLFHTSQHLLGGGSVLHCRQVPVRYGGHVQVDVDAVQERTRNLAPVLPDLAERAAALVLGVPQIAAGMWIPKIQTRIAI